MNNYGKMPRSRLKNSEDLSFFFETPTEINIAKEENETTYVHKIALIAFHISASALRKKKFVIK